MTNFRRSCLRAAKFSSAFVLIACLQVSLFPPKVAAESIEELQGMRPMSAAGRMPAMNSAPVEIAVADPMRISAMLGGTDSAMAADAARIAARSSGG